MIPLIISFLAGYTYYCVAKEANKNKIEWGAIGYIVTGICLVTVDHVYEKYIWNLDIEFNAIELSRLWISFLHSSIISVIGFMSGLILLVFFKQKFILPKQG